MSKLKKILFALRKGIIVFFYKREGLSEEEDMEIYVWQILEVEFHSPGRTGFDTKSAGYAFGVIKTDHHRNGFLR